MTSASAPGKIILFGEHAVVYGRPALAAPVTQVQAKVTVTRADPASGANDAGWQSRIRIEAPDIGLTATLDELLSLSEANPLAAAVTAFFSNAGMEAPPPLTIAISSSIPVAAGLGSGAAVTVAILRALAEHFGRPLGDEKICTLAFEVEKLHHGTPSGIDNTVITYGKPVYYIKGKPVQVLHVRTPFTIVIADTGIFAPTKTAVGDVRSLWESDPDKWDKVFDRVGEIVKSARKEIETGQPAALGSLMEENHELLKLLTVSCTELDRLVLAARQAGALGAKLSGGGRGGNMIALATKESAPAVAEALVAAGAKRTIITEVK